MAEPDAPTRAEIAELERRLRAVEDTLRPRVMTCAACRRIVPQGQFCAMCGAPANYAPPPIARPAPPRPVANAPPPAQPAQTRNLETLLGQRFAPRLGAILVFLGVLFFLGVAIQRGWIGPVAQLVLATLTGVGLVTFGAILTARRGYGTYPQVLEATGACILYLTAFLAHALPYYERETGLTELGSGVLMALVALATVGLALVRDSRVIVGLGYGLAFLTALLGLDVLPGITLAYVALLGTTLAALAARKGWLVEGTIGSLATGGLLLALAFDGQRIGDPDPALVAIVALAPAAAFLWLAARPSADARPAPLAGLLVLVTLTWASVVSLAAVDDDPARGMLLLTWALVALGHVTLTGRLKGDDAARASAGMAAVVLWLVGAPLAWTGWTESALLTTATYAFAGLILAIIAPRTRGAGVWIAAIVLAGAAALHAIGGQRLLMAPWEAGHDALGSWRAWTALLLVIAPLLLVARAREPGLAGRRAALALAAAFGALWTFALFGAPLLATAWLLAIAAALLTLGLRNEPLARAAIATSVAVLAFAAAKVTTVDTYAPARLDATTAAIEATLVSGALLAMHHLARTRGTFDAAAARPLHAALVGGSALVLANHLLAYTGDAWPSILLGALGVAYLAAGFVRRHEPLYRYVGFAVLGGVLLRVFLVDLRETDLAIRAIVFAVLGGILLGVGYAYAQLARKGRDT